MTREQLEVLASKVLDDVEISNRRGQRTLEHVKEFKRRFINEILLGEMNNNG